MYKLKRIIDNDHELIQIPKCMYSVKKVFEVAVPCDKGFEDNINIQQQPSSVKMCELELRQDQLLKKLDMLYNKIKIIASLTPQDSKFRVTSNVETKFEEVVLLFNSENLPWYLMLLKEKLPPFNIQSHIHSSVPSEKVAKIKAFVENLQKSSYDSKISLRLIFKYDTADSELKLSSLSTPIIGNVNILRYLAYVYPSAIAYDHEDIYVDALLDICHLLERTSEKNKEALINKLFSKYNNNWIYKDFSIVDLAAYSVIKQSRNSVKYVPKDWYAKCERQK